MIQYDPNIPPPGLERNIWIFLHIVVSPPIVVAPCQHAQQVGKVAAKILLCSFNPGPGPSSIAGCLDRDQEWAAARGSREGPQLNRPPATCQGGTSFLFAAEEEDLVPLALSPDLSLPLAQPYLPLTVL